MADLSQVSNEDLLRAAGMSAPVNLYRPKNEQDRNSAIADIYDPKQGDLSHLSNEELFKAAGIQDNTQNSGGEDKGPIRGALQGFNSAVPFGERLVAGMGALGASAVTGENVSSLYDEARRDQATTEEANPNSYLGGTIGGIAATLPVGLSRAVAVTPYLGTAANALQKAAETTGNFVRGSKAGADATLLAKAANIAGKSARSAVVAAPSAAVYGIGSGEEGHRLENAASNAGMAAGLSAALPIAGATLGAAASAVLPKVQEGLLPVVELAKKYKIPVSLNQVTDSNALKNFQKVSKELPFSGEAGFRQKQMLSFNKALFNTVGVDADRFTPQTMDLAFSKVGGEFDALTKGKQFNIGGDFINNLASTADEVRSTYGKDAAEIFQKEAGRVIDDFGSGDTIAGDLISRQRSRINGLARKSTDPNIKGALLDLENNIVDGITGGDPAAQEALSLAKQRYKNLIVLEPIANKAKGGFISPALLNNRVSQVYRRAHTIGDSGEIGDLARIGHELLPELGGSDTVPKAIIGGGIGTALMNPAMAAANSGKAATILGTNRFIQKSINRNQSVVNKAANKTRAQISNNSGRLIKKKP